MKKAWSLVLACLVLTLSNPVYAKKWPVYAKHGMVVSTEQLASEVGVEILKQGGNAVDAAVATGFALAVIYPAAGNIGGGGFMVIRLADGTATTIDYREKAPKAASATMYLDDDGKLVKGSNHNGYRAIGVPGTVAGFTYVLKKYGTMSLKQVMDPAIKFAEQGFPVSYYLSNDLKALEKAFKKKSAGSKTFFKTDGYYEPGDILVQSELAATLKRIAENGRDGFYNGETAKRIASDMKTHGGLITKQDLAKYHAVEREPIESTYRGYQIVSMPPPSSGGVTLSIILNILEGYDVQDLGFNSAAYIHTVTEAMRRAFRDRAHYLGDPDFNADMSITKLLSKKHAADLRKTIEPDHATKSRADDVNLAYESSQTTHFSVVDGQGNAVSNTFTIEQWYGAKIVADGLGFFYNNEMGDFNPWPGHTDSTGLIGTKPNLVAAGKRMLSSMCPTILAKDGKVFMVTGSPGGRTIINTVLQSILNVVDFKMNAYEAVNAPRFHHQWLPDRIFMEKYGTTTDSVEKLKNMGYRVQWVNSMGRDMMILINQENGWRSGGADARSANRGAVGY